MILDPELVGHKFARQAELARDGFAVPPLRCVPATVFDQVVGPLLTDIRADSAGSTQALLSHAEALRQRVRYLTIPSELLDEIDAHFDEIAGPDGLVAVRACAVPRPNQQESGEDSAEDPFAGLSDSFLYVGRAGLAERLVACWASAFNPEAVLYRARRGHAPFAARIAVGIQRMAMGTRSFVAFTRDPRDGAARLVIAAAYGIGEGVVQEKADVDHYFVDPATGAVEPHVTVKTRAVGWDPARPDEGPVDLPVPPELATEPVLTDADLVAIADLAARVEARFHAPQDIEGTITEDGAIHLVQARPVATPARPPDEAESPALLWDNNNVTESFPGISCALTYSVARELYEVGFTDLYRRMGVPARTLRRERPTLRRMIGHLDGRIYYQLDCWYRLHGLIRCFRPLWSTWERSLGLAATGSTGRDGTTARRDGVPGGRRGSRRTDVLDVLEILARLVAHPWRVRRFLRWWDGYHAGLADVAARRPHEMVDAYRALWAQVARRWGVTLVNGIFLFTATRATDGLLRRWVPGADRSLLNGLLCGGPENRSTAALHSAVALAATAAEDPDTRAALRSDADPRRIWDDLVAGRYGARFLAALREHLRDHGDRGMHDLKLETPAPRDEPWTVLQPVRAYLTRGLTVSASRAAGRQAHDQAVRELRERCRNPVKRAVLRGLGRTMRTLINVRENTRFCRSQLFGDSRVLLTRLGAELAARGRLDRPGDVVDLTVDEVLGAFDGTLAGADLRGLAAVRAAERARWTETDPLPTRLRTDPDLPLAVALAGARGTGGATAPGPGAPDGPDAAVLTGLASSSGVVRGPAKVVLDPSVDAEQCRDHVLVARETDPGWLYLMLSARALVVERGTLLSHTAITGRMLGIPTVVAVDRATDRITDGSLIEVDGTAGTVRILDGVR
ncbi:PEP/pyruvate-binding domain-containing protein [Micromonospora sp. DT227]|uniref:PEP/pyruvate-binding domain-containing protein n=1 Tax=Micromonospora sp. DT227 TaxID=3393433 RepID=UPI003CE86A72